MTVSPQPMYMRLDEYHAEHPTDLARILDAMLESTISSVEVDNGDLRLNYVDGNIDIIRREEFIEKISTDDGKDVIKTADQHIERIQSLYDDTIERQTESIRRKYRTETARMNEQMEREINWMQTERRAAMCKEMNEIRENVRG